MHNDDTVKTNKAIDEAWQVLRRTVYGKELNLKKSQQGTSESFLCARPAMDIKQVSTWGTSELYYQPADLLPAWQTFVEQADGFKSK